MRHILGRHGRAALRWVSSRQTLLAFDFDGTLAPIAARPALARMRPRTASLLAAVASHYPCVVISGRSYEDVARRLRCVEVKRIIGSHGAEYGAQTQTADVIRGHHLRLTRLLARVPGIFLEPKAASVAVHYRQSASPLKAREAILGVANTLDGVRVIRGKRVLEIAVSGRAHKGHALERARVEHGCSAAIFVGDDGTDEDIFRMSPAWPLVAIRVGRSRRSAARDYLRRQGEIDELLGVLLHLRARRP